MGWGVVGFHTNCGGSELGVVLSCLRQGTLCSSGCPGVHCVGQAGLQLSEIRLPLSPSAGMKGARPHPGSVCLHLEAVTLGRQTLFRNDFTCDLSLGDFVRFLKVVISHRFIFSHLAETK